MSTTTTRHTTLFAYHFLLLRTYTIHGTALMSLGLGCWVTALDTWLVVYLLIRCWGWGTKEDEVGRSEYCRYSSRDVGGMGDDPLAHCQKSGLVATDETRSV